MKFHTLKVAAASRPFCMRGPATHCFIKVDPHEFRGSPGNHTGVEFHGLGPILANLIGAQNDLFC